MSLSRIGKRPITLPGGVTVDVVGRVVHVKGPKGELQREIDSSVDLKVNDQAIEISPKDDDMGTKARHGMMRALISNMVTGVSEGYSKQLEVHGVGYRASIAGKTLKMSLGYSHEVIFEIPEGIDVTAADSNITVSGIDNQLVGETAAKIRNFRRPEPYKGKGIRYTDEYIIRKSGKTAA